MLEWYRWFRLAAAGIVLIPAGIWLMTSPIFRADPNVFTLADALPGLGALLVGLFLLGVACVLLYPRKPPTSAQPDGNRAQGPGEGSH